MAGLPARVTELSRQRAGGGHISDQDFRGVATTGAISFVYPFPAWPAAIPHGVEQSLIVNVKGSGLVVITGCGHMGLESSWAYVCRLSSQRRWSP